VKSITLFLSDTSKWLAVFHYTSLLYQEPRAVSQDISISHIFSNLFIVVNTAKEKEDGTICSLLRGEDSAWRAIK